MPKKFRDFVKDNLVKSRLEEIEIPFDRPKSIYRFRPLGLETQIATGSFERIINRTLYLSFNYLWFPSMAKPKNKSFIDITDGSFDVTKSSDDGLFYVEDTSQLKLFQQSSRYLDLDLNTNTGLEPNNLLHINNVKYLLSDFHMTTFVFLSLLQEYMQIASLGSQAKILGYLYACNQDTYLKTLEIGAPICRQIQNLLALMDRREHDALSLLSLAKPFVSAGESDKSLPIKMSLIVRLLLKEYSYMSDRLNASITRTSKMRTKLYDDVVLGKTLSDNDLQKLGLELTMVKDILKESVSNLYANLKLDLSKSFRENTPMSDISLNSLKGTLGFLCIEENAEPSELNPILRDDCFYFEDTIVADRIWSGEGENIFEESIEKAGGQSFWDALSSISDDVTAENTSKLDKFIDGLISYVGSGLLSNQFASNIFNLYIPESMFKTITGSDKPKSFSDFKKQAYTIAKNMSMLKDTNFMKNLDDKFKDANVNLEVAVRLYNKYLRGLEKDQRRLQALKSQDKKDAITQKAIVFLEQAIARESFSLYSLQYEIRQRRNYMQKQGFEVSAEVASYNPKEVPLGALPAWLTLKVGLLITVALVIVLASVWFFFIHESPAQRMLTSLENELEDVRDRLRDECGGKSDAYCNLLVDRAKELQGLVDASRKAVAEEKDIVSAINTEAISTLSTASELTKYALYGLFGLGVLWGGVKAIDIIQSRKKLKENT